MSVRDFDYPGNARTRPQRVACALSGVALWWYSLDVDAQTMRELASWLAPDEHARAQRFATATLAGRYIAGRAALRWLLGRRLRIDAGNVPIVRGARGRPALAGATIDFNVSHTRDVALIGITDAPGVRVGVDVEHAERLVDHVGLARKFLTSREQATLAGLDDDARRRAFLRHWTAKEAMSKATGDALAGPLRRLDVELAPALRLADGPAPYTPADWRLAAVNVPAGYLATAALWNPPTP